VSPAVLTVFALLAAAAGIGAVSSLDEGARQGSPEPAVMRGLVYADSFNGNSLDTSRWSPYHSPGNAGNGLRRPSAFSLTGNGTLVVTARMVHGRIVSGGMATRRSFRYGRFEVRVRTDPDPTGTMSGVVLTWPQSGNWPVDGENDIYETGNAANGRWPFHSFVHYGAGNRQYEFTHQADGSQWHTMVMDWRPKEIKIYRDGFLAGRVTNTAAIPDVPHFLTIQLDATATRSLARPVRMYVDYVRVYR
jgi:endo-1,3-1,4-beta-glycanase ExoK